MQAYWAQIKSNLLLMGRDRTVLFFSYLFPLSFFFLFAQAFDASKSPAVMSQVIAAVVIVGILGNGFFGAGMRTVQDRETNVLRRFKVAPISALPVIVASLVSGLVGFLPVVLLFFLFARVSYHMPLPKNMPSMLLFVCIGVVAFRAMGMIVAAVVNSAQEAQVIIQLLYLPMLFLSGATFPLSIMPAWLQTVAQFLPATYLFQGLTSIMIGGDGLWANWFALSALLIAMVVALFIGVKLFRWDKDEKIGGKAKLWILAVLAPFFLMGLYQAKTKQNLEKSKVLARATSRSRSLLFQNVRIFVGDGTVIANGAVLVKNGKIAEVYDAPPKNVEVLHAELREEAGRTLIPGLIDMHVHIGSPGGVYENPSRYMQPNADAQRLAAYLYCGITAVRSTGDWLHTSLALRQKINSGQYLGAEFFTYGPLFTAPNGHPTEMIKQFPPQIRKTAETEFVRLPKDSEEARRQVDDLKAAGVNGIKAVLDAGYPQWQTFNRLDTAIYRAVMVEAQKDGLPTATHTGSSSDVRDAIEAGSNSIEHGSMTDRIPPAMFAAMRAKGIAYDPTLSVFEAIADNLTGNTELLDRSLLQHVAPTDLLSSTRNWMQKQKHTLTGAMIKARFDLMGQNLIVAEKAGVTLIAGSDAGNMLVIHGPTVQHELELWVKAGIPPAIALQAATHNAAKILRADDRIGLIAKGRDATLVLLEGDPVQDISNTERIAGVVFRGEELSRNGLLYQDR